MVKGTPIEEDRILLNKISSVIGKTEEPVGMETTVPIDTPQLLAPPTVNSTCVMPGAFVSSDILTVSATAGRGVVLVSVGTNVDTNILFLLL